MQKNKSMLSPIRAWKYLFKAPVTIPKKNIFKVPREASPTYRGFHQNDLTACIGCGTCSEICPTAAIHMVDVEGIVEEKGKNSTRPAFDYGRCSFCGLCVDICTSDSLHMSKEYIHLSKDAGSFFFMPDHTGIHQIEKPKGYQRDEVSELLDLARRHMTHLDVKRKASFLEIVEGYTLEMAKEESARCVACGVCTSACPAQMNIPEYIKAIWDGDWTEGLKWIYKTNPLGNVCGRICTHNCETACSIGLRGEPVAIRWLKRFIVDHVDPESYEEAALSLVTAPVHEKIAIVGSGPSGLACAYYLRTLGYAVDVYESQALPGGVIRYGGPEYRLPEESVLKDISMIEKAGVKFYCNVEIGVDKTLDALKEEYDAVFLGLGLSHSKILNLPGCHHEKVYYGIPFLAQAREYTRKNTPLPHVAKSAVVIGAGNVAFDVARTLVRIQNIKYGESHVHVTTRRKAGDLTADLEEIEEGTEEGITIHYETKPKHVELKEEDLKGLVVEKGGKEQLISVASIYIAAGQDPGYDLMPEEMQAEILQAGKVVVGDNGQVEAYPWLFAGGDIVKGPDIISGVHTGHVAATGIDAWLRGVGK